MSTRILGQLATTLGLTLGLLSQANAVPQLRLTTSSGDTVTVADGSAADANPLEGVVLFSGPLGAWFVNVTTGISKPATDADVQPMLDLGSVNVSGGVGSITLELTDTGLAGAPNGAHIGA